MKFVDDDDDDDTEGSRGCAGRCHRAGCYSTVVETHTDDTHCSRLGSIKCQSWTDAAQGTNMRKLQDGLV